MLFDSSILFCLENPVVLVTIFLTIYTKNEIKMTTTTTKTHNLSQRGWSNVEAIMPKIKGAVEQRKIANNTNIDLSTAENWLIRPELIEICNEAIVQNLEAKVHTIGRYIRNPYTHAHNTFV